DAQTRQDTAAARVVSDSTMALVDRSCLVKQPERPSDYYEAERAIDQRAEESTLKTADFDASQLGQASDIAIAILTDAAPPDVSASEKSAVQAKDPELKSLLGIRQAQEQRVGKQAKTAVVHDTITPTPASAPAAPAIPAGAVAVNQCMMKNVE